MLKELLVELGLTTGRATVNIEHELLKGEENWKEISKSQNIFWIDKIIRLGEYNKFQLVIRIVVSVFWSGIRW